jgi:hypothetical protein
MLTWWREYLGCAQMILRVRTAIFISTLGKLLLAIVLSSVVFTTRAASLQTFAVVFGEITNEIASLEASFDNSAAQKQKLATLVRARSVILNPELRDEQTLAALVALLGGNGDYTATLDEAANNARAAVLSDYNLLGLRVANLPPSLRTARVRNRFNELADDAAALGNAQHAAGISALLAPFGRHLQVIGRLAERASRMPVPNIRLNSVRAVVNGHRFVSSGDTARSPNIFQVTAPDPLYREVFCRAVDGSSVMTFSLPVVTEQVRYEVAQGLAVLTYTPDVFPRDVALLVLNATNGTFFVQSDRNEVYGVFSAAGPGLEIRDGRFRIELPRELRGK